MSKAQKHDGVVYSRNDGSILWICYRDRSGKRCRESTGTKDWQEAHRKLRERLQARDGNLLEVIRKGESLGFEEWVDSFLENYSKPPIRAQKTQEANQRNPPESCVHGQETGGDHSRRYRRLPSTSSSGTGSQKTDGRIPGTRNPEVEHGAPGISGAPSHVECGRAEKAAPGKSLRWRGVPGCGQRPVSAALCKLVGTANDRSACSRIFAQHCQDYYRDRAAHL
jgi:hypothetical protein